MVRTFLHIVHLQLLNYTTMKVIIALFVLIGMALARPQQQIPQQFQQQYVQQTQQQQFQQTTQQRISSPKDAVVLKYESENDGNGQYKFAYETSDGQAREEQGILKNAGTEDEAISVTGSFSFLAPDGVIYTVRYIADENGFRPEGDHIPRRTPNVGIPAAALASLVGGGVGK